MDRYCTAPCLGLHCSVECNAKRCLIRAAADGDKGAQEEVFAKLRPSVLLQARVLCHHPADAEDLAQNCILHAMQQIHQLRDFRKMVAWTWRIVQNEHRMSLRRSKFAPPWLEPFDERHMSPDAAGLPDAFRAISFQELCRGLGKTYAHLSGNLRQVLDLRVIKRQSTTQAAQTLGVTEEVVRARLTRARQALRRCLS